MVARSFSHDFKTALDDYRPAKGGGVVLRAILESARQELLVLQTDGVNQALDDMFIADPACGGVTLDKWGVVYNLPRNAEESDADYRIRLLAKKRARGYTKTLKVLRDTVDALGTSFVPPLSVSDMVEKYQHAWEWSEGVPWYDLALCPMWVTQQHLWAIYIILDRAPTDDEAEQLAEALWDVKAVQQIIFLATLDGGVYTVHREVYANG